MSFFLSFLSLFSFQVQGNYGSKYRQESLQITAVYRKEYMSPYFGNTGLVSMRKLLLKIQARTIAICMLYSSTSLQFTTVYCKEYMSLYIRSNVYFCANSRFQNYFINIVCFYDRNFAIQLLISYIYWDVDTYPKTLKYCWKSSPDLKFYILFSSNLLHLLQW